MKKKRQQYSKKAKKKLKFIPINRRKRRSNSDFFIVVEKFRQVPRVHDHLRPISVGREKLVKKKLLPLKIAPVKKRWQFNLDSVDFANFFKLPYKKA